MPRLCSARCLGILVALAAIVWGGCGEGAAEPVAEATRVDSAALGLAIESLPANFEMVEQTDHAIILEPIGVPGQLEVTVGPAVGSVNLHDELNAHAEAVRARGGEYQGQSELMGPLGSMYLSRGRYVDEAGASVEEYKVIALHPVGDRSFFITYRYPMGEDTKARGEALIELAGEIVPAGTDSGT